MTPEQFKDQLERDQLPIDKTRLMQFQVYLQMLQEWNQKVNLTAITASEDVYIKHFYDSVTLANYLSLDKGKPTLCDVGSGAGFPSIPLKILFPNLNVTIVDSLNKRITFLSELVTALGLSDVSLFHDRAENFAQQEQFRESFDYVTARAVANMNVLSELCIPLNRLGGVFIAMKASSGLDELEQSGRVVSLLGGKVRETVRFELPERAGERQLILIDKKKETPNKYPRRPGIPAKQPLI